MNTRHLILTVAFGIGTLGPATVRAQDSVMATATLTAKRRSTTLYQQSALTRGSADGSQRLVAKTKTGSERFPVNEENEQLMRRGELVEAFLEWTERLVTQLDPFDVLETPFQPVPSADGVATPSPIAQKQWRPIPRVRPVQLPGGYGLVARITF